MKRILALLFISALAAGIAQAVDRDAFTVTRYQLEVQIDRPSHVMAVTGRLTLRNDSKSPQKNVSLQVSSSLAWHGIASGDKPLEWIANEYTTDIDHTGAVSEAVATIPAAVPPAGTISLDVQYGGTVTADGTRFTRLGAPEPVALRNDWDQISESFTALRGLGHVVWYPVSLPAVSLSDGDAVFATIEDWNLRHQHTQFDARIHATGDDVKLCIAGTSATASCGEIGQAPDPRSEGTISQITNTLRLAGLGKIVPAFAVANYERLERPDVTVLHLPDKPKLAKDYAAAAESNEAVLDDWLPAASVSPVVIELEDPNANPYQDGSLLFTPLRQSDTATLSLLLMPAQVASRFPSRRRWIEDGLQRFLQALTVEHRKSRKDAVQFLNEYLPALVKTEESGVTASSSSSPTAKAQESQSSLINTSDEIFLRGKGGFVFWMLRDMLSDEVLRHALVAYRPAEDVSVAYFQGLLEQGRKRDLEWFFDDWVYRDRGLPEFRVESVYARPLLENSNQLSLVTVTIDNRGGAGAEVPVLIQTASGERTVRVVAPARQKMSARAQIPGAPTKVVVNDGSVPVLSTQGSTYDVQPIVDHP